MFINQFDFKFDESFRLVNVRNIHLEPSTVYQIVGPASSGKSTLLKLLSNNINANFLITDKTFTFIDAITQLIVNDARVDENLRIIELVAEQINENVYQTFYTDDLKHIFSKKFKNLSKTQRLAFFQHFANIIYPRFFLLDTFPISSAFLNEKISFSMDNKGTVITSKNVKPSYEIKILKIVPEKKGIFRLNLAP
ncbi:ATP-binding cassette domain-containing protein [Planktomarina temperata]|nr:ATP-binding cassette domain-containing protein [Planktomarina temperata]